MNEFVFECPRKEFYRWVRQVLNLAPDTQVELQSAAEALFTFTFPTILQHSNNKTGTGSYTCQEMSQDSLERKIDIQPFSPFSSNGVLTPAFRITVTDLDENLQFTEDRLRAQGLLDYQILLERTLRDKVDPYEPNPTDPLLWFVGIAFFLAILYLSLHS